MKILARFGCVSTADVSIKIADQANSEFKAENTRLLAQIGRVKKSKGDIDPFLFGLQVLSHVLQAATKAENASYLMRRANESERVAASIPPKTVDLAGSELRYYFLETYGYRFTIILNMKDGAATLLNMGTHERDTGEMLVNASHSPFFTQRA
jgi:hypothetical protein